MLLLGKTAKYRTLQNSIRKRREWDNHISGARQDRLIKTARDSRPISKKHYGKPPLERRRTKKRHWMTDSTWTLKKNRWISNSKMMNEKKKKTNTVSNLYLSLWLCSKLRVGLKLLYMHWDLKKKNKKYWRTYLPNLLATVPPPKPPSIPPIANIETAIEYNLSTESLCKSSPCRCLYKSFINVWMFICGAFITPVLYPNCSIPNTAASIA